MAKSTIQTKVISGVVALLMIISLFFVWPTTAFAATAEEHTQTGSSISNDYLSVRVEDDGRHVLYTTGGDPTISSDNNVRLLYDCSSRIIIKVDSGTTTFAPTAYKKTADGTSLYSSVTYNGVLVERFISFSYNVYTSRYDTVEYKMVFTNTSDTTKTAGTRFFFDTMLGNNDSAPFRVNGNAVSTGTTYTGDNIPQTWQVFDSLTNPSVFASGTFYNNIADRPDKVQFLTYSQGSNSYFDCSASGSIGDSAVNVYFNPTEIAPGESRVVKTYYGLSAFASGCTHRDADDNNYCDYCGDTYSDGSDREPIYSVSANVVAPQSLLADAENLTYQSNPFSLSSFITNNGNQTLNNLSIRLILPNGLTTTSDEIAYTSYLGVNGTFSPYWSIYAAPQYRETTLTYYLEITADNMDPVMVENTITLPALIRPCNHVDGFWTVDCEPTCTTAGVKHFECPDPECGYTLENVYIAPTGHSYVTSVQQQVTCTTPGIILHSCENCDYSYSTYVYSEHSYSITEHVDATCYDNGYNRYTCSSCRDSYDEIIEGGHNYEAVITRVATSDSDGEITYTCAGCGDSYTEIIPARPDANVLLVQDRYPWSENNNVALLNKMLADGLITGWDITTTANFTAMNIAAYNVILIANDQSTATYNQLNALSDSLVQFATAGGVVIYGACDHGWAGGDISYSLPEGVTKTNFYSRYNYIVDSDHYIVTGSLTDGKPLTNNLLYGNYCSHTAFNAATLPEGANVILQDAHGDATLVEYSLGEGHIILSGLTWEFYYTRGAYDGRSNTTYTKNVYDDLIMYALYMSDPCDHVYDEGTVYEVTCTEDGYTLHTCLECGATMKDNIVEAAGHIEGEWETISEATEYADGLKVIRCTVCGETLNSVVLPRIGATVAKMESESDIIIIGDTVVFTLVIENAELANSIAVVPVFDTNVFELVNAEWLIDALVQNIEEGSNRAISAWNEETDINGAVYRVTLKTKSTTPYTSVGCTLMINDSDGMVSVVAKTVSVIDIVDCHHANTEVVDVDGTHHAHICTLCGYTVMEEHCYTDEFDSVCDDCGHERNVDGDVDGDGDVDSDDCIYLIYHVFFGNEDYPVAISLDFDGDGEETTDDGVYLLYYVFFGAGEYPLH